MAPERRDDIILFPVSWGEILDISIECANSATRLRKRDASLTDRLLKSRTPIMSGSTVLAGTKRGTIG
jgi:hypothetical protein